MTQLQSRRATLLIMAIFAAQPLAMGGWFALIPVVQENLGLSKSELALALIGMPIALVPALNIAARILPKFGPRRLLWTFFPLHALAFVTPALASSGPQLFGALFLAGASMAFIEVSMNVYAGRAEKQMGVLIMNRCHGFWALGIMTGSAFVAAMAGLSPVLLLIILGAASTLAGVSAAIALPRLGDSDTSETLPRRSLASLPPALLLIAVFMFLITLVEGTMADWAAIYMAERLNDPTASAGIAVTVFSGFMAGGRFLGDWFKARMGGVALARMTVTLAFVGLLMLVLPLPIWLVLPAFALVGFGVATGFPLGVSALAALDDRYEAPNIAIAATVAMGGFLIGPPMIGFVSEAFSIRWGFATLLPGLVIALWLTRWLRAAESS